MPQGIQDHEPKLELSLSKPGSLIRGTVTACIAPLGLAACADDLHN